MFLSITVDSVLKEINVYEIQTFKPIDDESGKYIYYVLRSGVTYNEYFDSDSDRQAKLDTIASMNPVQDCVDEAISQLDITDREIVDELPTQDISTKTIYMVPQTSPGQDDFYIEYMYINNEWEIIGKTTIDLSNYLAKNNTTAFTPSGDYNPATKKYVDEKSVPYQPFPSGIVTNSTTPAMITSIQSLNLPSGSTYLGEVTLTDMPFQGNAEVEIYVYPDNVIYLVLRSANVSPYIWQCNSHTYRGWESLGGSDKVFFISDDISSFNAQPFDLSGKPKGLYIFNPPTNADTTYKFKFGGSGNRLVANFIPAVLYIPEDIQDYSSHTYSLNDVLAYYYTMSIEGEFIMSIKGLLTYNSSFSYNLGLSKEELFKSNFVTLTSYQNISGKKIFNTLPESSVVPTTNDQLVNKVYVDNVISSSITGALGGSY